MIDFIAICLSIVGVVCARFQINQAQQLISSTVSRGSRWHRFEPKRKQEPQYEDETILANTRPSGVINQDDNQFIIGSMKATNCFTWFFMYIERITAATCTNKLKDEPRLTVAIRTSSPSR